MDNEKLLELLKSAGTFELETDKEVDMNIINNMYNPPISEVKINKILKSFFIRPILAVCIIIASIFLIIKIKENKADSSEFYDTIISQIKVINNEKDIDQALNIYAKEFFTKNDREDVRRNIELLFSLYSDIKYEPIKEKVIIKGNKALIENNIKYQASAHNKKIKPISYSGKERIYLKRYNNEWKIVAWLYEEK